MSSRPALGVYKKCLRSVHETFKNDAFMLSQAQREIRSKFQANAGETNPFEVQKMLADGMEAADFIKTFVVQAKLNPRGNFEMQVQPEHADATAEEAALRGKKP